MSRVSVRFDNLCRRAGHTARLCLHDAAGTTAIEYGFVAGLVSIVIVAAVGTLGTRVVGFFELAASRFP